VGPAETLSDLMPALRAHGLQAVSPSGVLGDAREASAAEGRALLESLVTDLAAFLVRTEPAALAR
jgi:creatinine amidohydrolase/Fe(II)-dependent formamide hydrolase-like protein